jgi:hypothetical protein
LRKVASSYNSPGWATHKNLIVRFLSDSSAGGILEA